MVSEATKPAVDVTLGYPDITDLERELVSEVLKSGVLALGPRAEEFETRLADMAGRRFGVSCSSGTAALHMAVRALGLDEGMEVITTPFSFVASANCILYERATPVFVDIEPETLGLDPDRVASAASDRTVGIVAVDVFGQPCRIEELEAISREREWWLVEDACEALGSSIRGRALGSFGEASTLAFYPNKQITTGEGGVLLTDDERLAAKARSLRNQGRDDDGMWLRHVELGYNYRLDELSAALGVAQLRRIDELTEGRRRVVDAYEEVLADLDWVSLPRPIDEATVNWFVYVIQVDSERIDRDRLIENLGRRGVPARPYFTPLHLQPYHRARLGHRPGDFPVTEAVAHRTLALPFSTRMTFDQIAFVGEMLASSASASRAA